MPLRALLLLSVAGPALLAQSPNSSYPLSQITVEGNRRFPAEKIISASGLKIGQPVNQGIFDAARARLLATGGFESVGYSFEPNVARNGYKATIDVSEVALMYRYRFEDLGVEEATLRAGLARQETLFGMEIPITPQVLQRYGGELTKLTGNSLPVEGRLSLEIPDDPVIVFRPGGSRPRIAEVHFTGNQAVESMVLADAFYGAAFGTEFSDTAVRRLLDTNVRPLYEARGYLRVAFGEIKSEPSKLQGVVGISVTVALTEGPLYKLGKIRFSENVSNKEVKALLDAGNFHEDQTANFDEVKAGVKSIKERYVRRGYLHAAVTAERHMDDKNNVVDLIVRVEPGAQYFYGNFAIRGLDILSEPVIKKMWGDRAKTPFDPEAPDAFLKSVREQQMFDNLGNTVAETKINEDSKTVDVTLVFDGARTPKLDPPIAPGISR